VRWNGSNRTTTYVSATQLTAAITAVDIASAGTVPVTVFNPTPGGGTSNAVNFTINAPNPAPTLSNLNPSSTSAGGAAFTLTVNGTNFVNGSVVRWNGSNRTTTYVSATQLMAAITAVDIATAGTVPVTVFNPTPGGGTSNAVNFTINASNPVPTLSNLNPSSATAGGAAFTLTVNGTNFVNGSVVRWNGSNRTTTYVSATQLTAAITAADIASAGTVPVTVFNPTPGGGTSNAVNFIVNPAGTVPNDDFNTPFTINATPYTNSQDITQATTASDDPLLPCLGNSQRYKTVWYRFTPTATGSLTVDTIGSNYDTVLAIWTGSRGSLVNQGCNDDDTNLQSRLNISATLGTTYYIEIASFSSSASGTLVLNAGFAPDNPVPTLSNLNPSSATAGGAAFTLTVNGANFVNGSVVRWNGSDRTTTYVSATQLTAAITAVDIASTGTVPVIVFNPAPGGGTSNAMNFTIIAQNPVPTLSNLNPSSASAGGAAFTLTVNGTNFVNSSVVRWNGSNRTTTYVSATQLTAAITAADIASAGTVPVTVFNPTPGGGTSNAVNFTINSPNPVPALSNMNPSSATAGGAAFTLTVNGTNFVNGSVVRWNGSNRTTTYVSATQLTAAITAADIASPGTASISVYNSSPGGGTSNAASFKIYAPAAIPFADGFEAGSLGTAWEPVITDQGRVQIGSGYPRSGSYSLLLDDTTGDSIYSYASAVLHVNLAGYTGAILDFWWHDFIDEDDGNDGVFIRNNSSGNWCQAMTFTGSVSSYTQASINLATAASNCGIAFSSDFQIKFQFYDNYPISSDGYTIDDISVTGTQNLSYIYIPYVTQITNTSGLDNGDFEQGAGVGWQETSSTGQTLVLSSGLPVAAHGGSWAARLGVVNNETSRLYQQVTIPSSNHHLNFWYWIDSADVCGYDYAYVIVNSTTMQTWDLCTTTNTGGWTKATLDLSAYIGQTVTLEFQVSNDIVYTSNLFIDDVAFAASLATLENPAP
ncbi:MAG: hypothetical protein AB1894_04950, partial [Chloroflexota bacterium]